RLHLPWALLIGSGWFANLLLYILWGLQLTAFDQKRQYRYTTTFILAALACLLTCFFIGVGGGSYAWLGTWVCPAHRLWLTSIFVAMFSSLVALVWPLPRAADSGQAGYPS